MPVLCRYTGPIRLKEIGLPVTSPDPLISEKDIIPRIQRINMKRSLLCLLLLLSVSGLSRLQAQDAHRPQFHFTPKEHWMNDPNGMYFENGVYHLFFQYYPAGTTWGPMHWGHATSKNMVDWTQQPIALYPDSLGYIFSGSIVADKFNTSGFGKNGKTPVVAIFTHHDPKGEKKGSKTFQNQSIAYSLDDGVTWTKYPGNPVLKNPGIVDFRDPKVSWFEAGKKWVMTLATKDRISFYSSPDLKAWTKESEFGETLGAHGGVWECPDLFPLNYKGGRKWVLLVSINPGGPNGGSATQYFVGNFDGKTFTAQDTTTRFIDYGPDDYAGVTFFGAQPRVVFMGWMSNWLYGEKVPTDKWRSAMTIPRELKLKEHGGKPWLSSMPVDEVPNKLVTEAAFPKSLTLGLSKSIDIAGTGKDSLYRLELQGTGADFEVVLSNEPGQQLKIGYEEAGNRYYIDRSGAGNTGFQPDFAKRVYAPRITNAKDFTLLLYVDVASVELFADEGFTCMTAIFFPDRSLKKVLVRTDKGFVFSRVEYTALKAAALK